ncbi:MAG: hypothetical protein LBV50_07125 [Novosphingobium sp.]|nr:hypothetical protein [Novosphingobium sp.]
MAINLTLPVEVDKPDPKADAAKPAPAKTDAGKPAMVTLDQLARELKMSPRDARMLLRLAAKQTRQYPNLGKEHVARQPWQWPPGSKALDEARKALAATPAACPKVHRRLHDLRRTAASGMARADIRASPKRGCGRGA